MDKLKPYSVYKCNEYFNWNHFLSIPYKDMNDVLIRNALKHSSNWVMCACGSQCDRIPRGRQGEPKDEELQREGRYFPDHIAGMRASFHAGSVYSFECCRGDAQRCLERIEARSAVLLEELAAKSL